MSAANSIEFRVEAGLEQVRLLGVAVRAVAEQFLASTRAQLIELCAVEIATNCVEHAYRGEPGHELRVCVSLVDDFVVVEVRDRGGAIPKAVLSDTRDPFDFDPLDSEALPEGGMGLALVDAMAESSEYFQDGDENVVIMRFSRVRPLQAFESV